MMNLIRSEFFKLRTLRLNIVLIAIAFAFVFLISVATGLFVPADELRFGSGPDSSDLAEIAGFSGVLGGLLMSVIGVLSISSEFAHGTIRPTLVATPNRFKVFGVKALVIAAIAAALGLLSGVLSYLASYSLLSSRGAEELELFADDGTVSVLIGMPIFYVILSLFGFGLGLLLRNSPAAVAIVILWPLIIENVLVGVLSLAQIDDASKFLPYQSSFALVTADADAFPNGRIVGGLYFGAVVLVLAAIAMVINNKRDV